MKLNATTPAVTRFEQLAARDKLTTLPKNSESSDTQESTSTTASTSKAQASTGLTIEQKRQIADLQRIDALVRAHEQAHISAGGSVVTSGPNYTFTYGPDGKQYAIAGEVSIDTSPEQKPQANIEKGQLIQRAALAPPDPSPQDFRAAAVGGQLVQRGTADLAAEQATAAAEGSSANASKAQTTTTKDVITQTYSSGRAAEGSSGLSAFA